METRIQVGEHVGDNRILQILLEAATQAEHTRIVLDELRLANFKSIGGPEATTVPLAPITLIYGPNSSGKSSLVQSLLLLKQTAESWDPRRTSPIIRGPLVDLGSFSGGWFMVTI